MVAWIVKFWGYENGTGFSLVDFFVFSFVGRGVRGVGCSFQKKCLMEGSYSPLIIAPQCFSCESLSFENALVV